MLGDAMEEIVGHADVENAGLAGHDVDVINHWRDFYMIGGVDDSGFGAGRGKEKRGPSATQPSHLTGSEMGRENWVAPVGMTGEGCALPNPPPPNEIVRADSSPPRPRLAGIGAI